MHLPIIIMIDINLKQDSRCKTPTSTTWLFTETFFCLLLVLNKSCTILLIIFKLNYYFQKSTINKYEDWPWQIQLEIIQTNTHIKDYMMIIIDDNIILTTTNHLFSTWKTGFILKLFSDQYLVFRLLSFLVPF